MLIANLFQREVTRNIAPVVYFHEQGPQKLAEEVGEYIITGGYPEGDPRHTDLGIHEQYVRLLTAIARELKRNPGPELPAAWISGFYGSGKSSFAKLLGLALDGVKLPDGRPVADALLARDESPGKAKLQAAWRALTDNLRPMAVVFDVGGEARDGEHIHAAVLRAVQKRLGYSHNPLVAHAELALQRDGQWEEFLANARQVLGKDWSELRTTRRADDHFSHVMHALEPARYLEPTSWLDTRSGTTFHQGHGVAETVRELQAMLEREAKDRTLFLVVDEVSQYVHQSDDRMLALQSFVSELGTKLQGKVWLLATGQQKLDDASATHSLGKLKDRFPASLRVHLATTNIRDVVHRRLLKKSREGEAELRTRFAAHGAQLKLYGYEGGDLNEEDFVEVYPMLPKQVDLLMELTTQLRARSSRTQGDDYAIRGLLQLLGELFRTQKLADKEVGHLVTLNAIYDVQQTALESGLQATMNNLLQHPDVVSDPWAQKAAKAVALLELNNQKRAVTTELVAACLYPRLGAGNPVNEVKPALEKLRTLNFLGYSEKEGHKLQSSEGQQWQREREEFNASVDERSRIVREKLADLMKDPERPRLGTRAFYWAAFYSDGRQARDERLLPSTDEATVTLDFQHLPGKQDRSPETWMARSAEQQFNNRIVWVAADDGLTEVLKRLRQSRQMVEKYENRRQSLSNEKKRILLEEQDQRDMLEEEARKGVERAFIEGDLYFRGQHQKAKEVAGSFGAIMSRSGSAQLPQLYTQHTDVAITDRELEQLLAPTLAGVSAKFLDEGLGLLTLDGRQYLPECKGTVPTAVLASIERNEGTAGNVLLQEFARPPYGFPADVVRASLAALVRGRKVKVVTEDGTSITSVADPGARETFLQITRLKRSELFPNRDSTLSQRDLNAMRKFFEGLGEDVNPEPDALGEAVFRRFGPLRDRLRTLEERFNQLPGRPQPEEPLQKLARALEVCRRAREIDRIVEALKTELQALQQGVPLMERLLTDLSEEAVQAVRKAADVRDHQVRQLTRDSSVAPVSEAVKRLDAQLNDRRPWMDLAAVEPALDEVRAHYRARREQLLTDQEQQAEQVRAGLRRRQGFERLTPDEVHQVFRPLGQALAQTPADAIAPTLLELRGEFKDRLERATAEAEEKLDELISARDEKPVVQVELNLRGKEISDEQELETVFSELRHRVGEHLKLGKKVRLR
ncbi:MAG: BREX system P-loop protein BrxC [Myxococcota bacterium]|nr:BREX system P-loop protein BrxC [Myxococcota bacterium]